MEGRRVQVRTIVIDHGRIQQVGFVGLKATRVGVIERVLHGLRGAGEGREGSMVVKLRDLALYKVACAISTDLRSIKRSLSQS